MQLLILALLMCVTLPTGKCACRDPQYATTCFDVFKSLENALINNEGNIYRIRKAFYYAPSADPVLLKVIYDISFENTTDSLPYCMDGDNSTAITIKDTKIVYGWTSTGVYFVINPLVLNYMQMTLPFAILRVIHKLEQNVNDNSPEVDTFLWDGSYDLPTLYIDLNITSLPCVPSVEIFSLTLEDLTTFLKDYASHNLVSHTIHAEAIAFALSEERISLQPKNDLNDHSHYVTYYCLLGIGLVILSFVSIFINYEFVQSLQSMVTDKISVYSELIMATIIIGLLIVFSEFVATCVYMPRNPAPYLHIYVWMSTLFIYGMFMLSQFLPVTYKFLFHARFKNNSDHYKLKFVPLFVTFTMVLFGLHIYIYALPAFLLLLVYPTKVIATTAYMIAFVITASVIGSLFIRTTKVIVKRMCSKLTFNTDRSHTTMSTYMITMLFTYIVSICVMLIALFGALIQFVYALVLGEASAITAGPYTVLSLIPSVIITAFSWMLKNKIFGVKKAKDAAKNGAKDAAKNVNKDCESAGEQKDNSKDQEDNETLLLVTVNEDRDHSEPSGSKTCRDYGATVNN